MSRVKNLQWGSANRPKVSNRLGVPSPREGGDGDMQIRQTGLGAKLFGRIGGRWLDTPLSIDGVTRMGRTISDHLAISREDITIFKDGAKVASFGEDVNLFGKIIIGKDDGTFDTAMNINIGSEQKGLGTQNIFLGYQTGSNTTAPTVLNIAIGYQAGKAITGVCEGNICIGNQAGATIEGGDKNICIGYGADVNNVSSQQRTVIGYNARNETNYTTLIKQEGTPGEIVLDATGGVSFLDDGTHELKLSNSGGSWALANQYNNADLIFKTNDNGSIKTILTIEGGEPAVQFKNASVGFTQVTPTFDADDTAVDFRTGNKQFLTFVGDDITNLNITFPSNSGNFVLILKQDGTGERTITNYLAFDGAGDPANTTAVKFPGGANPNLTDDANHVDIISFYWDATDGAEVAYGVQTLDFQF